MSGIAISRAGPDDLADAWAIVNEYYEAVDVAVREDLPALVRSYFRDGCGIRLARRGTGEANVVGCIALWRLEAPPASGEVKRLYVRPEVRGEGVAGLLLDALHEYARAEGYQWLYLDSKDDLAVAIRFYEKRGYRRCARYNDNPQATIFMNYRCDPP